MALAVLVGACATTAASEEATGAGLGQVAAEATPPPTTSTSTTTTSPPAPSTTTSSPTTTTVAPDPYEATVATIHPEIAELRAFDGPGGEPVEFERAVTNPTFFGNQLVLLVTDESEDGEWLEVQVPVRPNGTRAWIRAGDATISTHRVRVEVDVTDRTVTVWDGREVLAETTAVVGRDSSPTPLGTFYVNELIQKWDGSAYGPFILGLSGFSEALETFNGGLPVIAIHGTNRPELIGGAHSNGCIRIPNEVVSVLAEVVPMGTPVDIVA